MTDAVRAVTDDALPRYLQRQGAGGRRRQHQEQDPDQPGRPAARRAGGAAPLHDREIRGRGLHLRAGDERRRGAGSLRAQGGDRRVARLVYLPHGPAGRSDVGGRHPGPRQGRARPARGRCLDLPSGALRQHQLPDADVARRRSPKDDGERRKRNRSWKHRNNRLPIGGFARLVPELMCGL